MTLNDALTLYTFVILAVYLIAEILTRR